ncbi:sulfate transporter permease CysT [Salmonella enterica subsp. arizonae]|uniref:Sulfate transporter permease CysT n=1 Tax=Salmonella enterica subsp. arizonae TaxID=59203 RepID=A0A2X4TJC4_SALER|nr:sulfate transporter permease CysT [Salmonella enterica subsp. arizonae]
MPCDGSSGVNAGLAILGERFLRQFLAQFDIKVTYTWLGIAVAMAFTSIPFVVRTVQPVLEELGPEYEEAAQTLGATRLQSFRKVVLPELSPALVAGIALSFTRSLGEFGAVILSPEYRVENRSDLADDFCTFAGV